jgi:PhnB protein
MSVNPVPQGFYTVTPYLVVAGVAKLLDFVKSAFDANEIERHASPDGVVMHAQVKIGNSMIMMGDPTGAKHDWQKPLTAALYLYVPDCDKVYQSAIRAGAKSLQEPADMFYGDRHGGVVDPWGNQWWIATHKEDVTPDEMKRRAEAHMKG